MTNDFSDLLKDSINDDIDYRIKILESPVNGCDMCFDGKIYFHSIPGQPKHKCFQIANPSEYTLVYHEYFDEFYSY